MIKVIYIPCLFEDRRIEFETQNQNLRSILITLCQKYPEVRSDILSGISVRVNGKKIPPNRWKDLTLKNEDRITIIQEIGIADVVFALSVIIGSVIGYGFTAYVVAQTIVWAVVIASVAYSIYTTVASPKPSRGNLPSSNPLDNSPTYGWDGIKMNIDTRIPVPVVYGEHLAGGNLIACHVTTDGEKHYLNMLIGLCEGEIEGIMKSDLSGVCMSNSDSPYILVNGNPLGNFQGIWWDYRTGTQSQTPINGFHDIKISYDIGGAVVTTVGYIYTTPDTDVEAYEIRLRAPALYNIDGHGNITGGTLACKMESRIYGTTDWTNDGTLIINAAARTAIRRYFRKDGLLQGKYDIRVTLTQNSSYDAQLLFDTAVVIKYDNIAYIHTALVALKILSTEQLSGAIPNVLTLIRGRKVKNLQTGIDAWSQNPVYCTNDMIVSKRVGLGGFISQSSINIDQLIQGANYCEEIVGEGTGKTIHSVDAEKLVSSANDFQQTDVGKYVAVKSPIDPAKYTHFKIASVINQNTAVIQMNYLLHLNGVNGSTTLINEYPTGTWSCVNGAQLSTSLPRFGSAWLRLPATNSHIIAQTPFSTFNGKFTVEFWFTMDNFTVTTALLAIFCNNTALGMHLGYYMNRLYVNFSSNGSTWDIAYYVYGSKTNWVNGTKYKVAINYDGARYSVYVGEAGSQTTEDISIVSSLHICGGLTFNVFGWGDNGMVGNIDEIRITRGANRYSGNFTPEASEFPTETTYGWSNGVPSVPENWEWGSARNQLDIVIDSQGHALDMIQMLCASYRGVPVWIKDAIQIMIEKQETPSYIFNMGNIIEGSSSHKFISDKKKNNAVEVQFANRNRNYERESRPIEDRQAIILGLPKRVRSLSLLGATRESQIHREGRFHLYAAKYQDEGLTFKGGIDAIHVLPGEVVNFQHDVPQWGHGGRIISATLSSVVIDQEIEVEAGFTYQIIIKLPGTGGTETLETRTISNAPGFYNTLNVTVSFSSIPPVYGLYIVGKQTAISKPFRIMSIRKTPQNEIEVEATEYSDQVYVDTDLEIPVPVYLDLPNPSEISHITNLNINEGGIVLGDGTWVPYIELSFMKPETATLIAWDRAEIYISIDSGLTYEYYGKTDKEHGSKIENHAYLKIGNTFRVKVVSVAKNGARANFTTAPSDECVITGKTAPAEDVTNFTVQQMGDKLTFSWQGIGSKDMSHYEIREGPTWATSQIIAPRAEGTIFYLFYFPGGTRNYMIKAVDRTGNYSVNYAQYQISSIASSLANVIVTRDIISTATLSDVVWQFGAANVYQSISLIPTQGWDDAGLWDDGSLWDVPVSPLSGYFDSEQIDIGTKKSFMIVLDDAYVMDGAGQTATIRIRTSDNGVDWTAYATFVAGEYNARYFQLRTTLATNNANQNIFVTKFTAQAGDSKLTSLRFTNQVIASGGSTINFGYTYGSAPAVVATPVGASALIVVVTNLTAASVTIKIFNTAGADVGGTVNVTVEGY